MNLSNLTPDNEYEFRVVAQNAAGFGKYSDCSMPVYMADPAGMNSNSSSKIHFTSIYLKFLFYFLIIITCNYC